VTDDAADGIDHTKIRLGGQWLPADEVWRKVETATVAADAIERFNTRFPELSTAETREVVALVRERLADIAPQLPDRAG
jgi:hypothetical protein